MMNPWHYYNLCGDGALATDCLHGEAALGAQAMPKLLARIRAMADAMNATNPPGRALPAKSDDHSGPTIFAPYEFNGRASWPSNFTNMM